MLAPSFSPPAQTLPPRLLTLFDCHRSACHPQPYSSEAWWSAPSVYEAQAPPISIQFPKTISGSQVSSRWKPFRNVWQPVGLLDERRGSQCQKLCYLVPASDLWRRHVRHWGAVREDVIAADGCWQRVPVFSCCGAVRFVSVPSFAMFSLELQVVCSSDLY